jgi:triacylglycerol lipase
MVTRLTRLLLLLQGLFALGITLAAHTVLPLGLTVSILFGLGVVLVVRMAITANNFFINRYYSGRVPGAPTLSWKEWIRLYLTEFATTMYCSSWTMPFFAFSKRAAPHAVGLPVLLIHGYGCNSGYWHGMSKALINAGITHHAIDLEPVFADIDDYVPRIRDAVHELCKETDHSQVIIVAHSMGGLAARAYLRAEEDTRIAKVITLGSPHNGTGLANFGLGSNSQQMRWIGSVEQGQASDWLCNLKGCENEQRMARFVSIYSYHDNIIAPPTSSDLPCAKNLPFQGIGHVALAYSPAVQDCVIREILCTAEAERSAA